MQTGWLDDGGERYYLKGSGAMATGWREMDGAWYYFESSGRMAKGVIDVGGLHYYMEPSTGRMAAGTTVDIGEMCIRDRGRQVRGWPVQHQQPGVDQVRAADSRRTEISGYPGRIRGRRKVYDRI